MGHLCSKGANALLNDACLERSFSPQTIAQIGNCQEPSLVPTKLLLPEVAEPVLLMTNLFI